VSSGTQGIRVALLLLVTLAAGAAGGIAIDRWLVTAQTSQERPHGESRGRSGGRETTIEKFADELGLTAEQRSLIAPILVDTRARMSEVFDRVRPEYEVVVDSARARIEEILTPEQVRMYRQLLQDQSGDRRERPAGTD
jgi:Spy/CpxP family protein refolding chaperone